MVASEGCLGGQDMREFMNLVFATNKKSTAVEEAARGMRQKQLSKRSGKAEED